MITAGAREDARTAALDHAWSTYVDTLGKALDEDDWSGGPALAGAGPEPCAVVHLDGDLSLHYCADGDQERDALAFIAPRPAPAGVKVRMVLTGIGEFGKNPRWWALRLIYLGSAYFAMRASSPRPTAQDRAELGRSQVPSFRALTARSADGSAEPLGQPAEQILLIATDPRHMTVRPQ